MNDEKQKVSNRISDTIRELNHLEAALLFADDETELNLIKDTLKDLGQCLQEE